MIIKNNKILKVSAIATILSIGLLSAGYTLANKNITLVVKGKETEISTLKSNVEDVLAEQNVKYDKNDIISLPLDQKISDGDKIEVIKVTEKTIKENKEVPFEVNIVEDKNLLKGDTKVEVWPENLNRRRESRRPPRYHPAQAQRTKFCPRATPWAPWVQKGACWQSGQGPVSASWRGWLQKGHRGGKSRFRSCLRRDMVLLLFWGGPGQPGPQPAVPPLLAVVGGHPGHHLVVPH